MILVTKLQHNGRHAIGVNTFPSAQLVVYLKKGGIPFIRVPKCDRTGAQVVTKEKRLRLIIFAEYKQLLSDGWGELKARL